MRNFTDQECLSIVDLYLSECNSSQEIAIHRFYECSIDDFDFILSYLNSKVVEADKHLIKQEKICKQKLGNMRGAASGVMKQSEKRAIRDEFYRKPLQKLVFYSNKLNQVSKYCEEIYFI